MIIFCNSPGELNNLKSSSFAKVFGIKLNLYNYASSTIFKTHPLKLVFTK